MSPEKISIQRGSCYLFIIAFMLCYACADNQQKEQSAKKPNILLIVADDLGYSDISCYGGNIITPNIDFIAEKGIRFTNFHTAPMCSPTRAMLLSGNDNHIAGIGAQSIVTDKFGYEGKLSDRIVIIPELLKKAGYQTFIAGKWHLGKAPESNPHRRGFDHSFVLLNGAGNHYTNQSALHKGLSDYTEDGDSVSWPDGKYSSDLYTDKIISYIDRYHNNENPFFAYVAYTSPHWPLQVDKKHWKKYKGQFDDGYDNLKADRLESLKNAGIIPKNTTLPESHPDVIPWDSLSPEQQKKESRKMELYAGMIDNLDENIGRLFQYLKDIDEFENTCVVFMSDNGAAHRDFINSERSEILREYYNDDYEHMGNYDSYISYGPQWAEAGTAPFRYFKDYATQGGIVTPLIVYGPGIDVDKEGELIYKLTTVMDLAPTFYEIAEVNYPETHKGTPVYPLLGKSLIPFLSGKSEFVHSQEYVFALEHHGHAMLRKGNWKLTNFTRPFKIEHFGLYNLNNDIGEQMDLKSQYPGKYMELLDAWSTFSEFIELQTPTPSSD